MEEPGCCHCLPGYLLSQHLVGEEGLARLLTALRMLSTLWLSRATLPVLFSSSRGQAPYVCLNEAYPWGAGFTCSAVELHTGMCWDERRRGQRWMGLRLNYLTFSHTQSQMGHMHTRPLHASVPTLAHLGMIRLHWACWRSGQSDVTFIIQ